MSKKQSKAWRFRRCPACGKEFPAGELKTLTMGANYDPDYPAERHVPNAAIVAQPMNLS